MASSGPIDIAAIKRIHRRFLYENERMWQAELREAGQAAVDHVKRHPTFKPRSGKLQKSTEYRIVQTARGRKVRITNRAKHAGIIEGGSRPHVIKAKRGGVLHFKMGGASVFRRRVNHPGTKPYRFLWRASSAAHRTLGQKLKSGMNRVASKF